MSGGYFEHKDCVLQEIGDKLSEIIRDNNKKLKEQSIPKRHLYRERTMEEFKKATFYLEMAKIYVHRIDWFLSGDDGESTFHERIEEDLDDYSDKGAVSGRTRSIR